jgi:predicted MPP superfamily phosphohydrolase
MARSPRSHALSRRDILKGILAAGVGLGTGMGAYGYAYERHHLQVTRESLPVSGLPDALSGLRIGLVSDLHRSRTVAHGVIARSVELIMQERPDLIVLGGDYVTWGDRRYVTPAAEALTGLSAPHGVFAVLGNHDDDRDMPAALVRQGYAVLKDARTSVTVNGETLELLGIRFWTRKPADVARLMRGAAGTLVLLAHDPRRLTEASALNIPLILSGHTHGGQIVLPMVGTPARARFPTLWGLKRQENTTLFVSRGVGTVYVPVRWNCPPEVAVLTLQRLADF